MPRQPRDALDARIVELWRTGVQSARDVGLRIGLTPMHVGSRIARMVRSRTWPLDLPTKTLRGDGTAGQGPAAGARSRPSFRLEPARRVAFAPLSLRIAADLHTRLRTHCRETGATVSETLSEALEAFLRTKQGRR